MHSPKVELSFKVSVTSVLLENTLVAESDRRIRPVPLLDFWTCARAMSILLDRDSFSNTRMCVKLSDSTDMGIVLQICESVVTVLRKKS